MAATSHNQQLAQTATFKHSQALKQQVNDTSQRIVSLDATIDELCKTLDAFDRKYHEQFHTTFSRLTHMEYMQRRLQILGSQIDDMDISKQDPITPMLQKTKKRMQQWDKKKQTIVTPPTPQEKERKKSSQQKTQGIPQHTQQETASLQKEKAVDPLKQLFYKLARTYHPDLALHEQERLQRVEIMARINTAYALKDLKRLQHLAQSIVEGDSLQWPTQTEEQAYWQNRLQHAHDTIKHLEYELEQLSQCETALLYSEIQQAEQQGNNPWDRMKHNFEEDIIFTQDQLEQAFTDLEQHISNLNAQRRRTMTSQLTKRSQSGLAKRYDPIRSVSTMRNGLKSLKSEKLTVQMKQQIESIQQQIHHEPWQTFILFVAYLNHITPLPITALATFSELRKRYQYLFSDKHDAPPLAELISLNIPLVHYGPRTSDSPLKDMVVDLHLAEPQTAAPIIERVLKYDHGKSLFQKILRALGDWENCPACQFEGYFIHLLRCRGLDDLHARVCPQCGFSSKVYWVMAAKDALESLNNIALEYECLAEVIVDLAGASLAFQFLPELQEKRSVKELRSLLVSEFFRRYKLEIEESHVSFSQFDKKLPLQTCLADIPPDQPLQLHLSNKAPYDPFQLLEILKYRIQHKFSPDVEM